MKFNIDKLYAGAASALFLVVLVIRYLTLGSYRLTDGAAVSSEVDVLRGRGAIRTGAGSIS